MLNVFPDLLIFSLVAPFIIRIVAGFMFVASGYRKLSPDRLKKAVFFENQGLRPGMLFVWIIALIELVGGAFLVAGLYTQLAALILILPLIGALALKVLRGGNEFNHETAYYVLLLAICLSLLLSGAGRPAIDLPL
ncbi:MAG: DoxX family protein [bacterium]|nr:DoxX family protein [bacterium]